MPAILDYVFVPASILIVLALSFWSHRKHGDMLALKRGSPAYPIVAITMVVATLAQLAVPIEHKDISQPLLIVVIAWTFGALVIAGLWQRRGETTPSEPRA